MAWQGTVRRGARRVGATAWAIATATTIPACEQAAEERVVVAGPGLVIEGGASWDKANGVLRLIPTADRPGEPAGQLTLRNRSNRAVELEEPLVSCGCTSASLDTRRLAPGEAATLHCRVSWTSSRPVRQTVWVRNRSGETLRIALAVEPTLVHADEIVIAEPVLHAMEPIVELPLLLVHRSVGPPPAPVCAVLVRDGERTLEVEFEGWQPAVPAGADPVDAMLLVGRLAIPRSQLFTNGDRPAIVRIALASAEPMHVVVKAPTVVVARAEEHP